MEQLLLQPELRFNSLTLLAPGGVAVGGVACKYTGSAVVRMGLGAKAALVDARMVEVDRQQQLLVLEDGNVLPYDLLVIATGLQVRMDWKNPGQLILGQAKHKGQKKAIGCEERKDL
jgi:hypothetical protein